MLTSVEVGMLTSVASRLVATFSILPFQMFQVLSFPIDDLWQPRVR